MFGWHIPSPNEAMLISGRKKTVDAPFRIVTGHGTFVMPIVNKVYWLDLSMQEAQVQEPCTTVQGLGVGVKAVIAFKVGDDPTSITNAARRFLDDQKSMPALIGQIFAGHLRSIVGSMTIEDIIKERQKLAQEVLDGSKAELEKLGLIVDSFQIQSIDDQNSGYIQALAAPQQAVVQQNAATAQAQAGQQTKIAQANAAKAAAQVEQESRQAQIDFEKATAIKQAEADAATQQAQAQAQATINKANATAAAAGPLAQAQSNQAVTDEQIKLATKAAELKEQELLSTVTKPAEAEAKKIQLLAEADANRVKLNAEAMAAGSGVTIQQVIAEKMPEIIAAAAGQLANANITVLNGAEGLSEIVTGLAAQAGAVLGMVRKSLAADEIAQPAGVLAEKSEVTVDK